MDGEPLDGGISNAGKVRRAGGRVLRPATPSSESVLALLQSVRAAGFDGVPLPFGIDDGGRERLQFIEGDVPVAPYPAWSQTDSALASIARLLRGVHDASRGFDAEGRHWNLTLADPVGGATMCHNDVELSNVVFRDGLAVALIDFEFAAPGRAVYDLAHLARLCVPIEADRDRVRMGWYPADRPARLRLLADAYGLDDGGRSELIGAIDDALERIESAARRDIDEGRGTTIAVSTQTGGIEKYDRRRRWWNDHRDEFIDALR